MQEVRMPTYSRGVQTRKPATRRIPESPTIKTSFDPEHAGDGGQIGRWTAKVFVRGREHAAQDASEELAIMKLLHMLQLPFGAFKFSRNATSEPHAAPWRRLKPRT